LLVPVIGKRGEDWAQRQLRVLAMEFFGTPTVGAPGVG
jgi:hypothetical protein